MEYDTSLTVLIPSKRDMNSYLAPVKAPNRDRNAYDPYLLMKKWNKFGLIAVIDIFLWKHAVQTTCIQK